MGSLRAQAQFERAGWRLRILLPLWFLQLALTMGMTGLFAWRLGDSLKNYDDRHKSGEIPKLEIVWESTNVALMAISTICTLFEIARFIAESLTPWTVLFTHVIKLTIATAILVLDIVAHIQKIDGHYTTIGLALDAALLATAVALAIYAIISYRRLAAQGNYAYSFDIKRYGFRDEIQRDNSYSGSRRLSVRPTLEKRRQSSSSSRLSFNLSRNEQLDTVPLETVGGRVSYSHERDTQFDDYLARRESAGGMKKADVERALGAEFGWSSPPGEAGQEDGVVSVGAVKSRPRGASMPRASSYASDHVLVSVPEEEDAPNNKPNQDREALLGNSRRGSEEDETARRVSQDVDVPEPRWQRG